MSLHSLFAVALLLAAKEAAACVTAHTYMQNCLFAGDNLSVQVFDNGRQVCNLFSTKYLASDDTKFYWDDQHGCESGWSVSATHNGAAVSIVAANGYWADLSNTDQHNNRYVCGDTGDYQIYGIEYENCFSDNNGDCSGQAGCSLCDYKAYC